MKPSNQNDTTLDNIKSSLESLNADEVVAAPLIRTAGAIWFKGAGFYISL